MLCFPCIKLNANDSESPGQPRPQTHEWIENQHLPALPRAESCHLALLGLHNPARVHVCKSICSLRNCNTASMKEWCTPPTMVAFKGWTVTDLESSCCCRSWTPWMASLLGDSHVLEHHPAEWPPCDAPKLVWMLKAEYLQTTPWLFQQMVAFVS